MRDSLNVTTESLAAVLQGMVNRADTETKKSAAYDELFKAGSDYTSMLRTLKSHGMKPVFAACNVLRDQRIPITPEIYDFCLALPYLARKLENHIVETEGICCCVDKTFFLLSEELKRLVAASRLETNPED